MEQAVIVGVIVLFLAFILWNGLLRAPLRRAAREGLCTPDAADAELQSLLTELRGGAKTGPILQQIKRRVASTTDSRLQAAYLCAAGEVLRSTVSRRATALRYYVKALQADPACVEARHGMRDLLLAQRRGFKLEQIYWQILARLDFETHGREEVIDVWRELADLLERRRSGRFRATAIRRVIARLSVGTASDEEEARGCDGE